MRAGAGAAADGDAALEEGRVQAGPVVGLLGAHREAEDGFQRADAEVLRQERVLGAHAVPVVQLGGEIGRV